MERSNEERHRIACEKDEDFYMDIESANKVLTAVYLKKLGKCCGLGCRHCPYKDLKDGMRKPPRLILHSDTKAEENTSVLFWSGGKDCYIAYLNYQKKNPDDHITILTTFDGVTNMIGLHNIKISDVIRQAEYLKVDLLLVPLYKDQKYTDTIKKAIRFLECEMKNVVRVKHLLTGDLHLPTVINWRKKNFGDDFKFEFPNLGVPYPTLIRILEDSDAKCIVCATQDEKVIKIGDEFNRETFDNLPDDPSFDKFGENGEFHTVLKFN